MNRVAFLVDGFNLYHSIRDAERMTGLRVKWLNIMELCSSYLPHIHGIVGDKTLIVNVYYFSALAEHLNAENPDVTDRHRRLIKCFEDTGVVVELNRFKPKDMKCPSCKEHFKKYEEKETDVAIAVKLLETFIQDECDTAILVTGDTDIAPAVKAAIRLYPQKRALFAFPYKRKNDALLNLSPDSFKIKPRRYKDHQFKDPYRLSDGTLINKPSSW